MKKIKFSSNKIGWGIILLGLVIIAVLMTVLFAVPSKNSEPIVVKAYFGNKDLDPEMSCNKVFPVERKIPKTKATAKASISEMLKGTTEEETDNGYFTSIGPGVEIQSLSIKNETAYIDFNKVLEEGVGGSCRISAIRAQITETLKQFPTVKNVVISIDGRTEDILQP